MKHSKLRVAVHVAVGKEADELRAAQLDKIATALLQDERFESVNADLATGELEVATDYLFAQVHCSLDNRTITIKEALQYYRILAVPPERAEVLHQEYAKMESEQQALILWEVEEEQRAQGVEIIYAHQYH